MRQKIVPDGAKTCLLVDCDTVFLGVLLLENLKIALKIANQQLATSIFCKMISVILEIDPS